MLKTITLLASGTRGDVQPYLALALGLRAAGYHVRFATHGRFVELLKPWGLDAVQLSDNPSDLFAQAGHEQALQLAAHPLLALQATWRYWWATRSIYERLVVSAWEACQHSDAIVFGLPTWWAGHLADALQIPAIRGLLQPLTPTGEFLCPLLPWTISLGASGNRWSYRIITASIEWAWHAAIAHWRKTCAIAGATRRQHDDALTVCGFSQHVVPRPLDWPANHHLTGYWFLPLAPHWQPPPALLKFLEDGPPPIYIGFGSATLRRADERLHLTNRVLLDMRGRAIVLSEQTSAAWPRHLFPIGDVPHAWLLPRVAAAVHHGGAGTTAAAAHAGAPQMIVPRDVDQFFWGKRIAALGAGPPPIGPRHFTMEAFSAALSQVMNDQALKARARQLGAIIRAEEGVTRAVEIIQAWV